jgi:hypothetical protein
MSQTKKWETFESKENTFKNRIKWRFQRIVRGFDDREIHNLDLTLLEFIQPRLALFTEWQVNHGFDYPSDLRPEEWLEVLQKMDKAFTSWTEEDGPSEMTASDREGLDLFGRYINHLYDEGNPKISQ